jgi:hypothetical protein
MNSRNTGLPLPPAVRSAQKAMEMLRVWVVDGHQEIVLSPNMWKDSRSWGLLLVDIARHVANVYEQQGVDRAVVLQSIRAALDVEWEHPTE